MAFELISPSVAILGYPQDIMGPLQPHCVTWIFDLGVAFKLRPCYQIILSTLYLYLLILRQLQFHITKDLRDSFFINKQYRWLLQDIL